MAFSKVPSTFFGAGYSVETSSFTGTLDGMGNDFFTVTAGAFANLSVNDPVYLTEVVTGDWSSGGSPITGLLPKTLYYIQAKTTSPTGVGSTTVKFSLTAGGAAINFTGSVTATLHRLPKIAFTFGMLLDGVTNIGTLDLVNTLSAADANPTTGDYRIILRALLKALTAKYEAVATADRATKARFDTEVYQQGVTGVATEAYRAEFDCTSALTTLEAE
jgi:hypothetical protein